MRGVRAVLLAGGRGVRMGRLGAGRSKPLIPFGGTARLIDFSLRNARESGLGEVLLLSQYEERMLMDDLQRVWNREPGFRVHFGPYDEAYRAAAPAALPATLPDRRGPAERGTADALLSKEQWVFGEGVRDILVLHADHVYDFDYREMLAGHRRSGAALTVSYQRVERRYVHLFGMVEFDAGNRLTRFVEKPADPSSDLVFAAFCLFDARILRRYLTLLRGTAWQHDLSRDVIPAMLAGGELIRGHEVPGHWEDIGTVDRYLRAHRRLVADPPSIPPARLPRTLRPWVRRGIVDAAPGIHRSLIPADLVNHGEITDSVVYPGVRVGAGAQVSGSVLLPDAVVPPGAVVTGAVVLEDGSVQAGEPAEVRS
ncbi:sugar phosphate nucleotidyltransferase [Actinoplanes utahensis]|uniref:1-epi-valienol-1, 7-bisphosphate-1-adenylyltransferase n=1 Tax=Actinoplanes utahensis TaxID=1869 RepID=A0A0A6UL57_ACTUT|nr:sugar phosphate nucleotidyltransferase [Actinoplanes utahensis]KHD76845.1 1-epi-valienol-1,7-bisphosphate-1-adenylyltransferase [Actinoplanes utahensis]GIF33441.1 glucose-1-phosphate adenylyltransferase [Actinoplanes utahensis]